MLVFRLLCGFVCVLEIMVSTAVSIKEIPPKFSRDPKRRQDRKPNGRKSRSKSNLPNFHVISDISEKSLNQSQILEFIETIRTNSTKRSASCKKHLLEPMISLDKFYYRFPPSSYRSYLNQTKKGVLIAKYLTDMYISQSFSNKKDIPEINSFLRIILNEDKNLAGCGVAFMDKYFPYICKSEDGSLKPPEDFAMVYENFTNYQFFTHHSQKKHIDRTGDELSGLESVITPDDAYYGQPYYDCLKQKKWIVTISLPFYGRTKTGSSNYLEFK